MTGKDGLTEAQYTDLPVAVKELLTDMNYVGAPFANNVSELRDMAKGWHPKGGTVADETKMLGDLKTFVQGLSTDVQKAGGRAERVAFIDNRLAEIASAPAAAPATPAATAPSSPATTSTPAPTSP